MINIRSVFVICMFATVCCAQHVNGYKKKHHHHHGLHHYHFLYYLTFLAIKLKIVFFLGTIFTIGMVAAKVIAILKFSEYMKHKHHHHEEKIVYVNPHEHNEHDFGGYYGPSSKAYSGYAPDFSVDHPPSDAYVNQDPYSDGPDGGGPHYASDKVSGRSANSELEHSISSDIYGRIVVLAKRIRQMNLTDMALNEMGIKDEHCKKKFVCKADFHAQGNIVLQTGFELLRDVSYEKYKPNVTVATVEECDTLNRQCKEQTE